MFCLSLNLIISVVTFTQMLCVEVLTRFCSIHLHSLPVSSAALEACYHRLFSLHFVDVVFDLVYLALLLLIVSLYMLKPTRLLFLFGHYLQLTPILVEFPSITLCH